MPVASGLPERPPASRTQWEDKHHSFNFDTRKGPITCEWFKGGRTNITYNCLDRWVAQGRGNQLCFLWEGNDYGHERAMTYQQVLDEVCRVVSQAFAAACRLHLWHQFCTSRRCVPCMVRCTCTPAAMLHAPRHAPARLCQHYAWMLSSPCCALLKRRHSPITPVCMCLCRHTPFGKAACLPRHLVARI